jgi:CRP/FNR family transcriptional regulator, cyclic AMP receptor protein
MLGDTIELLETLPIFKGLSRRQLSYILDIAEKVYFEPGENLITRNCAGNEAYLILSGTARCQDFPGNPAASEMIGTGCLVGEVAMLIETIHSMTIQAKTRVRAFEFSRSAMTWVMRYDPAIAEQVSDNLLVRLQNFASDLQRLDDFLCYIEDAAPLVYRIRTMPEQRGGARPPMPDMPSISLRRLLQG